MGFTGHALEIKRRVDFNRNHRKEARKRYAAKKEYLRSMYPQKKFDASRFSWWSKEEIEKNKLNIRSQVRSRNRINNYRTLLILILLVSIFIFLQNLALF